MKCVVTLRTGCKANLVGAFSSNVGNVGQCVNAQKLFQVAFLEQSFEYDPALFWVQM